MSIVTNTRPSNFDEPFLERCYICGELPECDEGANPPVYRCPNHEAHAADIERRNKIEAREQARKAWNAQNKYGRLTFISGARR